MDRKLRPIPATTVQSIKIESSRPRAGIAGPEPILPDEWKGHPLLEKDAPPLSDEEREEARKMGLDNLDNPVQLLQYRRMLEASLGSTSSGEKDH